MRSISDPKENEIVPIIEKIEDLNHEADRIKKVLQLRRSATHKNLVVLAETLEQFSKEMPAVAANTN